MQTVPALTLRGKSIRLSGRVRAAASDSSGSGALWLRVDRPSGAMGFFDNMGDRPITSPDWKDYVIRGEIGFTGPLISDDLSMKALSGDLRRRTEGALSAGCDLVLHCNGDMAEMKEIAAVCPALSDEAAARLAKAEAGLPREGKVNQAAFRQRLDSQNWQQEDYLDLDSADIPIQPATGPDGEPITVTPPIYGTSASGMRIDPSACW